jgi:hypothetical protein
MDRYKSQTMKDYAIMIEYKHLQVPVTFCIIGPHYCCSPELCTWRGVCSD